MSTTPNTNPLIQSLGLEDQLKVLLSDHKEKVNEFLEKEKTDIIQTQQLTDEIDITSEMESEENITFQANAGPVPPHIFTPANTLGSTTEFEIGDESIVTTDLSQVVKEPINTRTMPDLSSVYQQRIIKGLTATQQKELADIKDPATIGIFLRYCELVNGQSTPKNIQDKWMLMMARVHNHTLSIDQRKYLLSLGRDAQKLHKGGQPNLREFKKLYKRLESFYKVVTTVNKNFDKQFATTIRSLEKASKITQQQETFTTST